MSTYAITKEIIHEQWGAPMKHHVLVRVDHDLVSKDSYLTFASYFNKAVYDNSGLAMSYLAVTVHDTDLGTQEDFINAVIASPDTQLSGGVISAPKP